LDNEGMQFMKPVENRWHLFVEFFFLALSAVIFSGCETLGREKEQEARIATHHAPASMSSAREGKVYPISAAFDSSGRLWRVRVDENHVYVDSSTDRGQSFGEPVVPNPTGQKMRANSEDRPGIAVNGEKIYVTWSADAQQPWTAYFSYSTDGGLTFSPPAPVSDQASASRNFLALPLLDAKGAVHFFWHDERNRNSKENGGSLLHAAQEQPEPITPQARRVMRAVCECCRIAAAFDRDGTPVLFARFVYPIAERDHGLMKMTSDGKGWSSWRVTDDNWELKACPEHGPALSIGPDGRYHIAWFTQGKTRQGLFYAWSGDAGKHFSRFMPFGNAKALAGHPAVLSLGSRVALAWQEFDGQKTRIRLMHSYDGGEHWSAPMLAGEAKGKADYPFLIGDGQHIYLSWNSSAGYSLTALN
jgi:hypothetical protein